MKCPKCDGRGKTTEYDGLRKFWCDYKCEMCNGTGEVDMTNEEWLKSMNTEQLAEEVYKLVWCDNELFQQMECSYIDTKENDLKIVKEWLKKPHREE